LLPFINGLLVFRQFIHCAHTTGTDIDGARGTIHNHVAVLYIEYKSAARAPLRKTHVIAMHWLALTDITTT
jgi:hypothetical protein